MKTPTSQAFIVTTLLYGLLATGGYWLFSQNPSTSEQSSESLKEVAVSLNMFQPAPEQKTVRKKRLETPPPAEMEKPEIIKPEPAPEPTPKPVPEPRPKPIETPEPVQPVEAEPEEVFEEIVTNETEVAIEENKPEPDLEAESTPQTPLQPVAEITPLPVKPQFSQQQVANAEQRYLNDLREQIALHASNTYPNRAKRRHWEGSVTLEFTLLSDGSIKNLMIANSSGRQILDSAATSILQSKMNNHFKSFPAEIQRKQWRIKLPVGYQLK